MKLEEHVPMSVDQLGREKNLSFGVGDRGVVRNLMRFGIPDGTEAAIADIIWANNRVESFNLKFGSGNPKEKEIADIPGTFLSDENFFKLSDILSAEEETLS